MPMVFDAHTLTRRYGSNVVLMFPSDEAADSLERRII